MNNGKICVSVCAETADETIEQIKRAEELADVIEIRFDCLKDWSQIGKIRVFLLRNKSFINKMLLATFRPEEEGGKNNWITVGDQLAFWGESANDKLFDIEDLEFNLKYSPSKKLKTPRIRSFHDFNKVPLNLNEIYENISQEKPDSIKIAAQTNDIADSIPIWKLLERAKSENRKIIPIAMGEAGKWTRILGLAHGAFMTYAALDDGKETAPGQVSARDLTEVYRVKELNAETEVYGILGGSTSVSLSPYIHNTAFKFHQLDKVFVPLQTHDLGAFIRQMVKPETREIELNFQGFSVTIPHKQAIIKHLDFLDETAAKIGAVNTVKIVDGKLHGFNTDAGGFIKPLKTAYGDLKTVEVAVLGAGGAARACVYALQKEGANVTIFARDAAKAKILADEFRVSLRDLKSEIADLKSFKIAVNTTPLGMTGKAVGETPATAEHLKNLYLVYDLVYTPFKTRLMEEAASAGVPTVGGMAMLIAQAMEQQKIWTGFDAPMKEMSRAALERLQR